MWRSLCCQRKRFDNFVLHDIKYPIFIKYFLYLDVGLCRFEQDAERMVYQDSDEGY